MFYRISIISLFFCSFLLNSCYTMSHPEPCPGLVDFSPIEKNITQKTS